LREVADWLGPYRRFWDDSFDRLDAHLHRIMEVERDDHDR